jgi:peptidoglycan/xylan/chitin deacetylase (PgdA/CDA1 family)
MYSFSLRFPGGKRRAMTFSYDDGIPADLRLIELMKKYGVKGTFNINTNHYEKGDEPENRLTKNQIKAIADDPQFEIACHGHRHPYYTYLPQATVTNDILTNRKATEEITNKIVRGFAYPYGPYNDISELSLKSADIVYARTVKSTNEFDLPQKWLEWHPTCHHKNALANFEKFMGEVHPLIKPLVMYVWGHTYEFDNNNNWELIEELFEKATKEDDIWFATNMEIYNYVNDFKSLIYSADGNTIYNPTRTDLWALCDSNWQVGSGRMVKIPAGETVNLYD